MKLRQLILRNSPESLTDSKIDHGRSISFSGATLCRALTLPKSTPVSMSEKSVRELGAVIISAKRSELGLFRFPLSGYSPETSPGRVAIPPESETRRLSEWQRKERRLRKRRRGRRGASRWMVQARAPRKFTAVKNASGRRAAVSSLLEQSLRGAG